MVEGGQRFRKLYAWEIHPSSISPIASFDSNPAGCSSLPPRSDDCKVVIYRRNNPFAVDLRPYFARVTEPLELSAGRVIIFELPTTRPELAHTLHTDERRNLSPGRDWDHALESACQLVTLKDICHWARTFSASSGSSILAPEAPPIPSEKQDRSPYPRFKAAAGQSGGSVQLLDAEKKKAVVATPSSWFSPEQTSDSGEIDSHHALFALLNRTYSRRLTGKLQLVFGRVEKALFFHGGQLVFATSSDRQDGLGEVMLRAGALTQSQFEEASTLVETGQRFGSAIAEMGVYGVEEIVTWVQRQLIQVTASVLDYPACRYYFFSSLEGNVVSEIGIPVPLGKLLLQAVRKADDLPLDRLAEDADLCVELSSDSLRLFKAVDLEDRERHLLGLISQRISAKDIVSHSGLPRPQASRALYALLLLGFVVGVPDTVPPEREPVVLIPPAELEEPPLGQAQGTIELASAEGLQLLTGSPAANVPEPHTEENPVHGEEPKAIEAPSAVNIPEQHLEDFPVHAEEAGASEAPSAENVTHAQPQLEEIPDDPEEPKETEAPPATPVPLLKANMISREVLVRAMGIPPKKNVLERQFFNEETTSVLVAETGGVIRLSAAVTPGQLLVLANPETKLEVIVQVVRKRAYKPTMCYLELEFVEAAPRFWGMEFSAATASLPNNDQDAQTAAMVITAEATADQPWILPQAPEAGELHTFKREVDELRGKPILTETPAASALAQLSAEVSKAAPIPGPGDPLSTEAILKSGMDAAGAALPIERDPVPLRWKSADQAETPQPVKDFNKSLPKLKRSRAVRGNFTPGFRRGAMRLAYLVVALVVSMVGAAWFKNRLPGKPAGANPPASRRAVTTNAKASSLAGGPETSKKLPADNNTSVASDAPVTSPGMPEKSASVSKAGTPALANGIEAPVAAASSSGPVEQAALRKNTSGGTTAGKPSFVRPAARPALNSDVTSGNESGVVPPKLIQSVRPVASLDALRDFERGNVVIDAVVGTSGEVNFISVISGPPSLRDVAVESLKQYKYEPATRNGQPVPSHVTITIQFRFEP